MLPIDLAGDWRRMNADLLRAIGYQQYDPAADAHGDAVACVGVRGAVTLAVEGATPVTRAVWQLAGLDAVPVLRSLVVDGGDTWVIAGAKPDPAAGTVHTCECYLG
jgi:hypothetical protein